MPIFEYVCKDCQKPFEALVMGTKQVECPQCHGRKLEQRISVFSVGAARSSAPAMPSCAGGSCGLPSGACCQED